MAETLVLQPIRPSRRSGLYSTPGMRSPEKASLTYKKGAILINNGGYIDESGADPAAGTIVGVADEPGGNGGSDGAATCHYTPALTSVIFEGSLENSGAAGYALVAADRLKKYGVYKDGTSGLWCIDQAETAAACLVIVDFISAVGDIRPRVEFVFLTARTLFA